MDRRKAIGFYSLLLLATAVIHVVVQPTAYAWRPLVAACTRVGVMLFLLWLAYPELRSTPNWLRACLVTGGVLIAWRPRLAIVLIPVAVVIQIFRKQAD